MPVAGRSAEAEIISSLNSNPLGTLSGEANLQTPFNATGKRPEVYIINWSRTRERKICTVPVSFLNGADRALRESADYRKTYGSVQAIYEEAKRRDMSLYETKVLPVIFQVMVDGERYFIPPAEVADPENPPVKRILQDGVWDIYLGNYERMHSPDSRIVVDEKARLALTWGRQRPNPVWKVTVSGALEARPDNPFGYVEFVRQMPSEAPQKLDREFLTALELAE